MRQMREILRKGNLIQLYFFSAKNIVSSPSERALDVDYFIEVVQSPIMFSRQGTLKQLTVENLETYVIRDVSTTLLSECVVLVPEERVSVVKRGIES